MNKKSHSSGATGGRRRLLVSILNWNNTAATQACLESIAKLPANSQPDVYLIDNDSREEPLQLDQNGVGLNSLQVIYNETNKGFAGGHNQAITYALDQRYDYVCLLNNDTLITDPAVFDTLIYALEQDNQAAAAAPTICEVQRPDTIWFAGGDLDLKRATTQHQHVGEHHSQLADISIQEVSFLTGCCLMINLQGAGPDVFLNEEYFLYWEDADWSARAAARGKKLLYVPSATMLHSVSGSLGITSPRYSYYAVRNRILFAKNWSSRARVALPTAWLGIKICLLACRRPRRLFSVIGAVIRGYIDGLRGKTGAMS